MVMTLLTRAAAPARLVPSRRRWPAAALLAAALVTVPLLPAAAATWTVDYAKSRLGFTGTQTGTPFDGKFSKYNATIDFDPANPAAGHALVVIDMASATTGDSQRDQSLPQADWFDAGKFTEARFEASQFRAKGGNAYEAVGTLTIRGIHKDVVLPFTLDVTGDTARAKGRLDLIRTDYGVGQGPWSSGQYVALEVAVTVDLTATRQP